VTDYILPGPDDLKSLGRRAGLIRERLGIAVSQLAAEADVTEDDIAALRATAT
jgi:predicted transcriptional regulator